MAFVYSFAENLRLIAIRNPAYALFAAFLASVFFVNGAAANAIAVLCFSTAWLLIIKDARSGTLSIPHAGPWVLAFLIAINLRLLLPPYGVPDAVPGTAITRGLLLIGLYGLTLYVYPRVKFQSILWLVAGAAFTCSFGAIAVYLSHLPADGRLTFFGRASHPIFGAGAMATGAVASIALLAYCADGRRAQIITVLLAAVTCVLIAGIFLSGSRGPMLALAFAVGTAPSVVRSGSRSLTFATAFAAFALVAASVLIEAQIKALLCPTIELACRPSFRHDVWAASSATVMQHPLWGSGYGFRFEGVPHAHNAYLGMALHYGIPLCILFICLMAVALSNVARMKNKQERFFVVTMLIFANGFMASDLSDPMRFFNTHYLFLWFPLFLALVAEKSNPTDYDGNRLLSG